MRRIEFHVKEFDSTQGIGVFDATRGIYLRLEGFSWTIEYSLWINMLDMGRRP